MTILLPAWFQILEKLKLPIRTMPRDVSTHWNSTYNMLEFAMKYRKAIDDIAGSKMMGLCQYEMSNNEWTIVQQLTDTLKVHPSLMYVIRGLLM